MSPNGLPMPDDLRTRIAKVLHRQCGPSLGAHPDGWDREPVGTREMYLEDADAVIRELGLRLDTTCHIHDREGKQRCHRYVTEWTADE